MNKTLLSICGLLLFAACTSSQFSLYRPKNSERQWNITANKTPIGSNISIAINDSVVAEDSPGLFSNSFEAKGTYQGHDVRFYAVYNNGFLGIGAGWETTVFVDNEMAARFKL